MKMIMRLKGNSVSRQRVWSKGFGWSSNWRNRWFTSSDWMYRSFSLSWNGVVFKSADFQSENNIVE